MTGSCDKAFKALQGVDRAAGAGRHMELWLAFFVKEQWKLVSPGDLSNFHLFPQMGVKEWGAGAGR